jgi:hypothetical protein
MSPQQPLERRWERFRSAIPSPRSMAGPQRRLQANGGARSPQSGRNRPSFGEDWAAGATQTDRQDRRVPRCTAGHQVQVGRRPRMLPRQSVLMLQPCMRAGCTVHRTLPQTRDGLALGCRLPPCSGATRRTRPSLGGLLHPQPRTRGLTRIRGNLGPETGARDPLPGPRSARVVAGQCPTYPSVGDLVADIPCLIVALGRVPRRHRISDEA